MATRWSNYEVVAGGRSVLSSSGELAKATPARPAPSSTHGRWIRFNPQTGEPLATPYWEELPPPDRK